MDHKPSTPPEPLSRQPWEEPAIVLERSLEVKAQDAVPPGNDPLKALSGFLGPLNSSGIPNGCG